MAETMQCSNLARICRHSKYQARHNKFRKWAQSELRSAGFLRPGRQPAFDLPCPNVAPPLEEAVYNEYIIVYHLLLSLSSVVRDPMFNSTSPLIDTRRSFADARSSILRPLTTNPAVTTTPSPSSSFAQTDFNGQNVNLSL